MEKYFLEEDILLICNPASSFPDGVLKAHQELHGALTDIQGRKYYGISQPGENGNISYKAAAEAMETGEAARMNMETFVLAKGEYVSIFIENYLNDIPSIGRAFQELIALPDIDPQGWCVEMYVNERDIRCMVKLKKS